MPQLFKNNSSALLDEDLQPSDLTITLAPGEGDRFPQPDNGDPDSFAVLTLEDVSGNIEITKMPERTGDVLTIERAQENTAALGFAAGSRVELRLTSGTLQGFKQIVDQHELRGQVLNTDGARFWHQTDASGYQFYTVRYYTSDIIGVPVMHIEPPPGITGLNILATIIDAEGNQRGIRLGEDIENEAPEPSTGKVMFDVPGTLRVRAIDTASTKDDMHVNWDTYEEQAGSEYRMKFEAATGMAVRYTFVCRTENGLDSNVTFREDGGISYRSYAEIRNHDVLVYPDAQDVSCQLIADIWRPNAADWMVWQTEKSDPMRSLWYTFQTVREDTSVQPSVFYKEAINFYDGEILVSKDPTQDDALARKSYVDAIGGGYGRSVLWNNDAGQAGPSPTISLQGVKQFSDYYSIEVTAFDGTNSRYASTTIDTQTLIDKGYGGVLWQVMADPASGDEARAVFLRPESDTSFTVQSQGTGTMKITRVLGLFPKPV